MFKSCNNLDRWKEFTKALKKEASAEDQYVLIEYDKFERIVN